MIWKLREIFAEKTLKKITNTWQNKGLTNIVTAKRGLVLVTYSDIELVNTQEIVNLFQQISPHLRLKFVSYIKNPKVVINKQLPAEWKLFTKRDLNFNLSPKEIASFSSDIILDFTSQSEIPMLFVLLLSKAKIRMGARNKWNEKFLDFMIKSCENKPYNYTSEQLVHYLNKINRNNAA